MNELCHEKGEKYWYGGKEWDKACKEVEDIISKLLYKYSRLRPLKVKNHEVKIEK